MRPLIAVVAESVVRRSDNKIDIVGITSGTVCDDYPKILKNHFIHFRGITDSSSRRGDKYALVIVQKHEDGTEIERFGPLEGRVGDEGTDFVAQIAELSFPKPGVYSFDIVVNTYPIGSVPFIVKTTAEVLKLMKADGIDISAHEKP